MKQLESDFSADWLYKTAFNLARSTTDADGLCEFLRDHTADKKNQRCSTQYGKLDVLYD